MGLRDYESVFKAAADPTRVRILKILEGGEMCVCQVIAILSLGQSTVSKHLSILFQAGLVESRKDGRWIYYQLPGKTAPVVVREAFDWIEKALADNSHVLEDNKKLQKILKQDPAEICKRQCKK